MPSAAAAAAAAAAAVEYSKPSPDDPLVRVPAYCPPGCDPKKDFVLPDGVKTICDNLKRAAKISNDGPFLGHRVRRADASLGEYQWTSYSAFDKKSDHLAVSLAAQGLKPDDCVGIYSINTPEWVLVEHACYKRALITVPLYDTLGKESIEYIINQTELTTIACTKDKLPTLRALRANLPSLRRVVIMDAEHLDDETASTAHTQNDAAEPLEILYIAALVSKGARESASASESPVITEDHVATICYTSGTTGMPKGAVLTHKNMLSAAASLYFISKMGRFPAIGPSDIHVSYLPLAHVFERVGHQLFILCGSQIGFYGGSAQTLMDDIQILRPTIFISVPRLFNRIHQTITGKVKEKGGLAAALFNFAVRSKNNKLKDGSSRHFLWDPIVFRKVRERLGGRVRLLFSGSAPLASNVADFLRICFSCPVSEGYGQTETAAGLSVVITPDMSSGHVGGPLPNTEIKLFDVPSLGYTNADKPYPRGEICARGPQIFSGYFKLPDKTKEVFREGGWLATGDVGQWGPGGRLEIIDRIKSVFKLSQGEFIAPEQIESIYMRHDLVHSVFIYGDPLRSSVVAIVHPAPEAFAEWKKQCKIAADDDVAAAKELQKVLAKYVREQGLKGYEAASAIYISKEDFTLVEENKTPTWKLRRDVVKKNFGAVIDELYASLEGGAGGGK